MTRRPVEEVAAHPVPPGAPAARVFRVETQGGIAHLVVDDPARKVNVLDEAALTDLERAVSELENASSLKGVVVRSGKRGAFIAGADVHAIASITSPAAVRAIVARAHAVFQRLASLRVPTVAAIDGACLGGGTELALACDSRVASDEPHTQIGLPEVLLGIIPAFGGSTRLPRLVGVSTALDLILTGRALDARRAERSGLIARAVPAAWLVEHAVRRVDELAKRPVDRRRDPFRPRTAASRAIDGNPFGRALAFQKARSATLARTGGHYPAPLAAIGVIEHGYGQPLAAGFELEAQAVSELAVDPICKNLIRIFLLSEHAKKGALVPNAPKAAEIRRIGLVGAGIMGGGIAEVVSRGGMEVRVRDLNPAALTRALATARGLIDERLGRRRLRAEERTRERDGQLARILPTVDPSGMGRADLVIEAVVEDLDVKRRVFGELEVRMRPDAVLATNTSSLSVDALAGGLKLPDRFCGLHFFNPVHRMPLVEIVRGARTSDAALATAVAFARRLGKTPVVVNDAPGFVVNRLLMPYLREAMHLLEEGYSIRVIDGAMRKFGMPMGPFEVVDEVGIDVASKVASILGQAFPGRMTASPALEKLAAAGRLGRKSGRGFYRHAGRKREPDPELNAFLGLERERSGPVPEAVTDRMVLAMINEGARVLEESVAGDAGAVDLAMVFGAGFPPFRGGPMRHADAVGLQKVESQLAALRAEKGERFAPSRLLAKLAQSGGRFTGTPV